MPPGAEDIEPVGDNEQIVVPATDKLKRSSFGLLAPIVWINVAKFVVIHFLAICGVVVFPFAKWQTWVFFVFLKILSNLGVTAGAHRLWSHKSYKATLPYKIMVMFFNCISFQNSIYVWTRDHRVHHKFTETDADPHNARRGFFFAHIGWLMMKKHPDVIRKGRAIDMSDIEQDSVAMFQHRNYYVLGVIASVILPTSIPWCLWGENGLYSYLTCGILRYVLTLHDAWLVNSAAHLWGSRPYSKDINPAENYLVSLLAIGEGWHNYHHTFPYDYAASEWGPNLNLTTCFIDFCAFLGLVYDRKQVSSASIDRVRRRKGDLSPE